MTREPTSHPTWVRGLKYSTFALSTKKDGVAPHVGAWIEMHIIVKPPIISEESHPTWVRGLKFGKAAEHALTVMSHPTWVRGLKSNFADVVIRH